MKSSYPLSSDYKRLKELMDNGHRVVCYVDEKIDGTIHRLICEGRFVSSPRDCFNRYSLSVYGREFAAWNNDPYYQYPSFDEVMKKHNVHFIDIYE